MLKTISIASIYADKPLPVRMAQCTPDMAQAISELDKALEAKGAKLVLSDLFRSYEMQFQANLDYTSGKKKAFSPAPGGSMHEAGRAMDISLEMIAPLTLKDFWEIAIALGFCPIIGEPNPRKSEAWHFDYRGSFQKIYDIAGYKTMASLAILEQGINVDEMRDKRGEYLVQSGLVRLDKNIGKIDGCLGSKCKQALKDLGYIADEGSVEEMYSFVNVLVREKYPEEY